MASHSCRVLLGIYSGGSKGSSAEWWRVGNKSNTLMPLVHAGHEKLNLALACDLPHLNQAERVKSSHTMGENRTLMENELNIGSSVLDPPEPPVTSSCRL